MQFLPAALPSIWITIVLGPAGFLPAAARRRWSAGAGRPQPRSGPVLRRRTPRDQSSRRALVFSPNVEVGFGDDVTLVALNFEFVWKFPRGPRPWAFYAGGGPAINLYQSDGGGDDADGGFNLLAGLENRKGLFFEFKVGVVDSSPDFKFGVGFTFR